MRGAEPTEELDAVLGLGQLVDDELGDSEAGALLANRTQEHDDLQRHLVGVRESRGGSEGGSGGGGGPRAASRADPGVDPGVNPEVEPEADLGVDPGRRMGWIQGLHLEWI